MNWAKLWRGVERACDSWGTVALTLSTLNILGTTHFRWSSIVAMYALASLCGVVAAVCAGVCESGTQRNSGLHQRTWNERPFPDH